MENNIRLYNRTKFNIGIVTPGKPYGQNIVPGGFVMVSQDDVDYLSATSTILQCGSLQVDDAHKEEVAQSLGIEMENNAKDYLKEEFLMVDGSFKLPILNTMQTPALFALKLNLVEGVAKQAMLERLRANFEEHDNCLQTGFLGTSILMQTLTENGMADMAYELLFQRKNPS